MRRGNKGKIINRKIHELQLKDRHQGMYLYFVYEITSHET